MKNELSEVTDEMKSVGLHITEEGDIGDFLGARSKTTKMGPLGLSRLQWHLQPSIRNWEAHASRCSAH